MEVRRAEPDWCRSAGGTDKRRRAGEEGTLAAPRSEPLHSLLELLEVTALHDRPHFLLLLDRVDANGRLRGQVDLQRALDRPGSLCAVEAKRWPRTPQADLIGLRQANGCHGPPVNQRPVTAT